MNFRAKCFRSAVSKTLICNSLSDLRDAEITNSELPPVGARKYSNPLKVIKSNFSFEPLCSTGKFSPERSVANEQESSTDFVLVGILQSRGSHNAARSFLIVFKLRTLEIAFQKFRNDFVFRDTAAKTDEARERETFGVVVPLRPRDQEWNRHAEKQENHRDHLNPDHLRQ